MATINLKEYIAKLDELLEDGAFDAVKFHSQHILQQFPKNIAAFRRLALAQVRDAQWENALKTLRHILTVFPDDKVTHYQLSQINNHLKRSDDAIWHLERVYEQDPNDPNITRELRELYHDYHNIEQAKLQLTTGAVARQYARNQLYDQAVDILRKALSQSPDRVDLRLLLARIQREAGRVVESAETALDVLSTIPDCLEANFILTELWLSEQRPTDAQRYISRIETVDPYMALEIARGVEPDEDAITLNEADYQSAAQKRASQASPDWLESIDLDDDALDEAQKIEPVKNVQEDEDLLADILGDDVSLAVGDDADWLGEVESMQGISNKRTSDLKPPLDEQALDLFGDDFADADDEDEHTGLTGLLSALDEEAEERGPAAPLDMDNLFGDFGDENEAYAEEDIEDEIADADDALGWMQDEGIELADERDEATTSVRDTGEVVASSDAADPLAWIQGQGIEVLEDSGIENAYDPYGLEQSGELRNLDEVDPMAWMQGQGVELVEEEISDENTLDFGDDDEDDDSLAWLKEEGVALADDEEAGDDEISFAVAPIPSVADDADDDADELDWLTDESLLDEMLDMENLTGGGMAEQPAAMAESESEEEGALDDWLGDDDLDLAEAFPELALDENEDDDWLADDSVMADADAEEADDVLAMFDDMDEDEDEEADEPMALFDDMDEDDEEADEPIALFDDMDDDEDEEAIAFDAGDSGGDWLSDEDEEALPEASGGTLSWLSAEDGDDEDSFAPESDAANWLDDQAEEDAVAESEAFDTLDEEDDWLGEAQEDEISDGKESILNAGEPAEELTGMTNEWQDAMPEQTENDFPDWMDSEGDGDELDWLSDENETAPMSGISAETEEDEKALDWMLDLEEDEETVASEASTLEDEAFDWSAETSDEEEDEVAPTIAPKLSTDEVLEPALFGDTEDGFEWSSDLDAQGMDEVEDEPFVLEADDSDEFEQDAVASFGEDEEEEFEVEATAPSWLDSLQGDEDGEVEADAPNWLSEIQPEAAMATSVETDDDDLEAFEDDFEDEDEDAPDWLGSLQGETEDDLEDEELEFELETPDWLGEAQPEAAMAMSAETDDDDLEAFEDDFEDEDEDAPDWLGSLQGETDGDLEDEELEFELETPDWLGEAQPEAAMATEAVSEDFEEFDDDFADEEEPDFEAETPDWLSEAQPETAMATEVETGNDFKSFEEFGGDFADEEEPDFEAETPDWLTTLQSGDDLEDEEEAEFEPETPDWLSEAQPETAASEAMGDDFEEEEEELEFAAEADAPDWLGALQGDADDEFEDEEEDALEANVPDWISGAGVLDEAEPDEDALFDDEMEEDEEEEFMHGELESLISAAGDDTMVSRPQVEIDYSESLDAEATFSTADSAMDEDEMRDVPDWLMDEDEEEFDDEFAEVAVGEMDGDYSEDGDNTPDWLNAMAPGLDIDYEAEEDAPIESEFMARSQPSPQRIDQSAQDFDWLTNIVEEESKKPPLTLPETPGSTTTSRPKFVFSRPPLWLRNDAPAKQVAPAATKAAEAEFNMGEIGEDLPEWLDDDLDFGDNLVEDSDDFDDDDFIGDDFFDDDLFDDD